jgi:hypothetical protein
VTKMQHKTLSSGMEMHISGNGRDGWTSYPTSAGLEAIILYRDMVELVEVWTQQQDHKSSTLDEILK